ncbi:hypothetical protein KXD40_009475 [Peronospora effusa]|uniref:Secreted protein n=1 Tax=Peronospora effusa TaxID=542832 RepID=A0A3M6VD67_9STRA|nr:hypothetical protein DD238_007256 [Peronospora effusa]RQM13244.1 hypothetical protein DD237_007743 [Peronospora effusa]UIZ28517.1 hypothetical protein KXD40_009475 [Peronospora effusa]CAI5702660.1 unnamed protein product [Peronospora effusa]
MMRRAWLASLLAEQLSSIVRYCMTQQQGGGDMDLVRRTSVPGVETECGLVGCHDDVHASNRVAAASVEALASSRCTAVKLRDSSALTSYIRGCTRCSHKEFVCMIY